MLVRIFFFLIGFGLTVIGSVYILVYLNLLTIGYNFLEYVNFIIRRFECLISILGVIIMYISIMLPGGKNNELHLWYSY